MHLRRSSASQKVNRCQPRDYFIRQSSCGKGRLRHASSIGIDVAAELPAWPARACRPCRVDRPSGASPESRSGQASPPNVCGWLCDVSSQRTRSCQGPLPPHAISVPATALRDQFELGLGAHLLSGVRRWYQARPIASRHGDLVASCRQHITVRDPSTRAGAGALAQAASSSSGMLHRIKRRSKSLCQIEPQSDPNFRLAFEHVKCG